MTSRPTWTHTRDSRYPCDVCSLALRDYTGPQTPRPNPSRYRRTDSNGRTALLCYIHAQPARDADDATRGKRAT